LCAQFLTRQKAKGRQSGGLEASAAIKVVVDLMGIEPTTLRLKS
jgi:hypothetical protein